MLPGACVLLMAAVCGVARADSNDTELRDAVTGTSIDLFKAVSAGGVENLVLAPIGVNILLALLEQGAAGQSALQLRSALRLERPQLKEGYGGLSEDLQKSGSQDVQLEVANRVFVDKDFPVQPDFLEVAARDFGSGVENITSEGGGDAINAWVARATHDKITNIVEPVLPVGTVMVLANAIYFKSPWLNPFNKFYTHDNTFRVNPTKNVTVPLMFQQDYFQTGSNEDLNCKWVELYFKGENYSLLVILPNEQFGLADLLARLAPSDVTKMLHEGAKKGVSLYLPRFSLATKTKLVPALKQLGITEVFEAGRSDLSGISSEPLSVSDVLQKATMEIDEEGGVASAAAVGQIVALSAPVFLDLQEIRVDHPFIAIIVDRIREVPLFISTIVDPST
ncbi:leukocyte elastase inhibitor-like [Bacillus rossius redtenbacheri]|uniref:leukocyte elastase inhibitor-like n=1 Tax=Bacillus rossius redtenbacheri TaxID=93214 RepID=UPI002FDE899B